MTKDRKKIDLGKGLYAGQQVSDMHQHKNRPAVLSRLQSAYLLESQKRGSSSKPVEQ